MAKDGKQLEQLVHLIEKSILPNAQVEYDVKMPILNSRIGATTQCDIVIRSGTPPRQTITLVEVQDRGSRVKPNDFRGWKQKLEDVGAQHLICVSRQEFPESIKEQASLAGNAIMLVTLKEATPDTLPLGFVRLQYQYRHFDITKLTNILPSISKSEALSLGIREMLQRRSSIELNERCWSLDKEHLISLFILCRDYYLVPKGRTSGTGGINFDIQEGQPLYHFVNGIFIRCGLVCEFEWTDERIEKPVSMLTYEQNEHGALAWVAEVVHESSKGNCILRMPLIKSGENYIVRSCYAEMPGNIELSIKEIKSIDTLLS